MSRIDLPGSIDGSYIATRVTELEHEVRRMRKTLRNAELRGTMNKTFADGYYLIPAGPSRGTAVASSASANTYGSYVEMRAAASSVALYVAGFSFGAAGGVTYGQIAIATGESGSESIVSETRLAVAPDKDDQVFGFYSFIFPIPVPANTRIAVKSADSLNSAISWYVSLHVINETDLLEL